MRLKEQYFFLLLVMLLIVFVAILSSCNNKEDKTLVLTTYGRWWTGIELGMKEYFVPEYKKLTDTEIKMVIKQQTIDTLKHIREDVRSGKKTADFIWIDLMDLPAYIKEDLLLDVSDVIEPMKPYLPPMYIDAATGEDGIVYAIPNQLSIDLMMYDSNKLTPQAVPDTYEELLEWVKANPGRFCYRGKGEQLSTYLMNLLYAFKALGPDKDPAKIFDPKMNPEIVIMFEYLRELYQYVKQPLYESTSQGPLEQASEEIWLFSNWDSDIPRVRVDKGADFVKLHPNFQLAGPDGDRPICSGGWYLAVPKSAAHPEEGKKFIAWMSTKENILRAVGRYDETPRKTYGGHIPIRTDAIEALPDNISMSWWDIQDLETVKQQAFTNLVNRPTVPYYHDLSLLLQRAHNDIVVKGRSIETTLKSIQAELDLYVESYLVIQ